MFAVLHEAGDFEEVSIDGTVIRAHQHAAGAAKKKVDTHLAVLATGSIPKSMSALKGLGR